MRPWLLLPLLAACTPAAPDGIVVAERVDLAGLLGLCNPQVVGATFDADGLVVLEAYNGLYRVDGTQVASSEQLALDGTPTGPYTDVAALGGGQYAVTVRSNGLLFDSATGHTEQHFCYEPDGGDWVADYELTTSLAYDPAADRLWAQPQTLTVDGDEPIAANIAEFEASSGTPLQWHPLADERFLAGALTVDPNGGLLIADGSEILGWSSGEPEPLFDLAGLDVGRIDGLAIDPDNGDMWLVDGDVQQLVQIKGWR